MNLNLQKRDIKLLIIFGGLVTLLLCYLLVFNKFNEKRDAVDAEIVKLQPELDTLREYQAHKAEYEDKISVAKTEISSVLSALPTSVWQEDQVLLADSMEHDLKIDAVGEGFSEPILVKQLKGVTEDKIDNASSALDQSIYKAQMTLKAKMTYNQMKDYLDYIFHEENLTGLESMELTYNAEDRKLDATTVLNSYYINYANAPEESHLVPNVSKGVKDPFGTHQKK
ncbi:MAG: hypothetical protein IIU28_02380 [Lachnospiraceae bacterium]|nr:hypothetical protein [Lachnospiraceae bacterium]